LRYPSRTGRQPKFFVADECAATLDVPIQADILNLLKSLQQQHRLKFLFISQGSYCTRQNSAPDVLPGLGRVAEEALATALLA
jgi:ABC-type oligopeptide transport system ATPase subunit